MGNNRARSLSQNLHFSAGFYKITKIIGNDLFMIEGDYLIKLKKPNSSESQPNEFLKTIIDYTVRIIPHKRNQRSEIISDVWLGGVHLNKEVFSNKERI